ncbi:NAD(P)-binding protein [Saitoella complicata NRRL Y-17804]|uniref:Ketoreductase (KR) domain-containing protein n=1 Tax=Saitoella complicata (strain BCRC 22490 / CBS 7301 / JCM 7358 / NBRC 10748 / NRRL Y-17804) TaxID=698492 RepID=A0A0E9N8V3_SAICN|nr:NAD(P)-binding protein [Saitoella complicata NRRL Y-17804]ODQ54371.1 NAD(P)-binding protein [Saitoella complicata NRRL Y-17804]GAO45830.1 hypothetical protein G7K_0079-t1 [Saitoella complicata NRRL Y-17804]
MPTLLATGIAAGGVGVECLETVILEYARKIPIQSWTFILAQHDPRSSRSREAVQRLQSLEPKLPGLKVEAHECDLSKLESVRNFAARVKQEVKDGIEVMLLNAGAVFQDGPRFTEGVEETTMVNHIGHFLLLALLKDQLRSAEGFKAKVVFTGSELHKRADPAQTWEQLSLTPGSIRPGYKYDAMQAYGCAKLLQAYCLPHWSSLLSPHNTTVTIASPGFVPSTLLSRSSPWHHRLLMNHVIHYAPFARTPAQGGRSIARVICDEEHLGGRTGVFVDKAGNVVEMHGDVYVEESAKKVWNRTCEIAEVKELVIA